MTMWKTVEVEEEEAMVPLGQMNLKEVVEENYKLVGTLAPPQLSVLLLDDLKSKHPQVDMHKEYLL